MNQLKLFPLELPSPHEAWDKESAKRALDDLFKATLAHRQSDEYHELMKFVSTFRFYSPYNAFLIYTQRPGARFVAPAHRWKKEFSRRVKPNANPLIILQPMGPVMFVFDVSDTEPLQGAKSLPLRVTDPFKIEGKAVTKELVKTIENSKRDGVRVFYQKAGSQAAGCISRIPDKKQTIQLQFQNGKNKKGPVYVMITSKYEICLKEDTAGTIKTENYATLVHELGHLYCGHLGTTNKKWWPDRRGLPRTTREFEAESISFLVCKRLGIRTQSEKYLSGYIEKKSMLPPYVSLECIMKSAGLIEQMASRSLKIRKE